MSEYIPEAWVEAAAKALWEWNGYDNEPTRSDEFRAETRDMLAAVLPLIADAIEADPIPDHWTLDGRQGFHIQRTRAARLVRGSDD